MPERPPSFDTDAWLDALAGRRPGVAETDDGTGNAEGALLREALRRWPSPGPTADAAVDRARLAALLAAAHTDDRLRRRSGCAACQAISRWLSWRRLAGATALVVAASTVVMVVPWLGSVTTQDPSPTLRGPGPGTEAVQRLRAADPGALRDRIVEELAQLGVAATRYERLGRYGLDAELPSTRSDALIRLLGDHGIQLPASGALVVEIEAAP